MTNKQSYTLITGASGGIGYELAILAAKQRSNLLLVARSAEKLESFATMLRSTYNIDVITLITDLSQMDNVKQMLEKIKEYNLEVDTVINNAGFGDFGDFADASITRNLEMIALNISALTLITHDVLQQMKRTGKGRIMNVASTAAFMPGAGMAVYYASKAYVLSFSEALFRELKGSGITITTLCPGPTDTGFAKEAGLGKSLLHKMLPAATSADVARFGYRAMLKGKAVVVPGFMNKLSVITPRFSPRWMVRNLIYSIHKNH
jgi:hypothetical protein